MCFEQHGCYLHFFLIPKTLYPSPIHKQRARHGEIKHLTHHIKPTHQIISIRKHLTRPQCENMLQVSVISWSYSAWRNDIQYIHPLPKNNNSWKNDPIFNYFRISRKWLLTEMFQADTTKNPTNTCTCAYWEGPLAIIKTFSLNIWAIHPYPRLWYIIKYDGWEMELLRRLTSHNMLTLQISRLLTTICSLDPCNAWMIQWHKSCPADL